MRLHIELEVVETIVRDRSHIHKRLYFLDEFLLLIAASMWQYVHEILRRVEIMGAFGGARAGSGSVTVRVPWRSRRSTINVAPAVSSQSTFICTGAGAIFFNHYGDI